MAYSHHQSLFHKFATLSLASDFNFVYWASKTWGLINLVFRMNIPLSSSKKVFCMVFKTVTGDVTSFKNRTWMDLGLFVKVSGFHCMANSRPSHHPVHESCCMLRGTYSTTSILNHSIIMFLCLINDHAWKHVVGFPHNKFSFHELLMDTWKAVFQ